MSDPNEQPPPVPPMDAPPAEGAGGEGAPKQDIAPEARGPLADRYKQTCRQILLTRVKLVKAQREKQLWIDRRNGIEQDLAKFDRYVKMVEARDKNFPESLTCLGCQRTSRH